MGGYKKTFSGVLIGCHVIRKKGPNFVEFTRVKHYEHLDAKGNKVNDRLFNIIYHENNYYVCPPCNVSKKSSGNLIDNNLWLVCRYLRKGRAKLKEGSVIRFGRIPFRVTRMRLDLTEPDEDPNEYGKINLPANSQTGSQFTEVKNKK